MKKKSAVWTAVLILFTVVRSIAQPQSVQPYQLAINVVKTTTLVFPSAITSVDKGSRDVLVQKATGVDNVLQIKAGSRNFAETNLTVITNDGKLYTANVRYAETPGSFNYRFSGNETVGVTQAFAYNDSEAAIDRNARVASLLPANLDRQTDDNGIKLLIDGLFISGENLYFRVKLSNTTNINYGVEQLRFFIRDQDKGKRTSTQEIESTPVHVLGDGTSIIGSTEKTLVYVLRKFTIPDQKVFIIQLSEKNGGRNLELQIKNKQLIKAKTL
ncbi:conjugative transposon protein TraN [Mucilaginibacter defluvii]|uniref:Conjugative transposon protein TraN n=1 Tax=Mucilaginibacter defluvii TaxID=1196019 RepID=A0ABP9FK67_9SPHI